MHLQLPYSPFQVYKQLAKHSILELLTLIFLRRAFCTPVLHSSQYGHLEVVGLLLKWEAVVDLAANVSSISLDGDITGCEFAWIMSLAYVASYPGHSQLSILHAKKIRGAWRLG